jgi:ribosomal protein S18 acetylase RimI-like enzyme
LEAGKRKAKYLFALERLSMCIRPACPSDFHSAARLIHPVYHGMVEYFSGEEDKEQNPARYVWLEDWFQQTDNRFSYQQAFVKEVEGQVVAVILIYHGSEAKVLERPLNERLRRLRNDPTFTLEQEAELDEFYIDTLSVLPAFSGRGYATALFRVAEEEARKRHSAKIGCIVHENNERISRLCQHLGFQTDRQMILYGQRYFHMVKSFCEVPTRWL